jgi:hypothetical protein
MTSVRIPDDLLQRLDARDARRAGLRRTNTIDARSCDEPTAYWDLRRELEAALGRPLDLFTEADDARFVAKARARGEVIYAGER